MVEYAIKIELPKEIREQSTITDDLRTEETSETTSRNSTKTQEVKEQEARDEARKENIAAIAKGVTFTAAAANYAASLYVTHKQNTYAIQGDYVAAENLSRKSAIYTEVGNNVLSLGLGFAMGGLAGGAAMAGALALSYAKKALDIAEQNRVYRAEGAKQAFEYSLNAERMIRSYAGLR